VKITGKQDFLKKTDQAIADTKVALADARKGRPTPGEPKQYEMLLVYLQELSGNAASGKLPSRDVRRRRSLGWILVDNWDPADPLGALILNLNDYYINKL
jgi:hypothetical protein